MYGALSAVSVDIPTFGVIAVITSYYYRYMVQSGFENYIT
jgi:hypothetical protein